MPIGDHLRWLARAGKRARAKSGGLKRYPRTKSAPLDGQMRRRRARAAALARARAGGWLRGAAARSVCAGSSQRPEIIRPRRSLRTPLLLTARRPARGRARSGGWRRRHGSVKRCAGCSRARNHSALGARAARNTLALLAHRTPSGRPAAAHARKRTHIHERERESATRNAHKTKTQCFSP